MSNSFSWKAIVAHRATFLPARPYGMLMELIYRKRLTTLRNPQSFAELLVAKNATDRNPLLPKTADKYDVREYVAERVGEEYLVPLYQWGYSVDDIDWSALKAPFVMKATHGYDMNHLVRANDTVDVEELKAIASSWLATHFYDKRKEWMYKGIRPKLVFEEFLGDGKTPPPDIKFYVFNGRIGLAQVDIDRFTNHTTNMYDRDWNRLNTQSIYGKTPYTPEKPENIDELMHVAETLAKDFKFIRVDLYNVAGRIYLGEITHYPGGGTLEFAPREIDEAIGELWRNGTPLPSKFFTPYEDVLKENAEQRSA